MRLYDEIIHDILTSLEKQDKHILPAVSYTHLDVYKRQASVDKRFITGGA